MAKAKQAQEVKTIEQMQTEIAAKRQDLIQAKRGLASGELANPMVMRATRKEIARLLTAIRAAEQTAEGEK